MSAGAFAGRGVVLLGGTAGVGLETACRFAEEGARGVVLMGRDEQRGADACEVVRSRGGGEAAVSFVRVDARRVDAVRAAAASAEEALDGAVDVFVSSSGPTGPPKLLHNIALKEIAPTVDGLLLPPLLVTAALLPGMRERRRGSVVLVASDAAKTATPGETLIGAAMAAIVMFTRATAIEAKREGVRLNAVTPSLIANTPGSDMLFADPFAAKLFEKAGSLAHLGVPEPTDLADTILFLAGDGARRIAGQAISVNGGISAA